MHRNIIFQRKVCKAEKHVFTLLNDMYNLKNCDELEQM